MKRTLTMLLSAVLALGVLAGCGAKPKDVYQNPKPGAEAPKPVTLKIGQLPIVDGLPFWVAQQKEYYKAMGVNVQLITFKSANDRDAALVAGEIDGMLADPVATTTLAASGTKVQIASLGLGANMQEGPMSILAAPKSGVKEITELKGQEIAISTNSIMHFVAEQLLLDAGFTPDEIKFTNIAQIPVRYEALMSGQVKAAILPDPLLSLAANSGAPMLVDDTKAKKNYSMSVIVFTEKALTEKLDGVKRFFNAYNLAVLDIKKDPNAFKELLVTNARLPKEIKEKYQVVPFSFAQAPNQEDLMRIVQWLADKKIIAAPLTYDQLVNKAALPATQPQ